MGTVLGMTYNGTAQIANATDRLGEDDPVKLEIEALTDRDILGRVSLCSRFDNPLVCHLAFLVQAVHEGFWSNYLR